MFKLYQKTLIFIGFLSIYSHSQFDTNYSLTNTKGKKMIRINITTDNIRKTKSFLDVEELDSYLINDCGFMWDSFGVANKIWHLNVGSKLDCDGFRFSIQSKQRSGNILMNGK